MPTTIKRPNPGRVHIKGDLLLLSRNYGMKSRQRRRLRG